MLRLERPAKVQQIQILAHEYKVWRAFGDGAGAAASNSGGGSSSG